jgi:hypothetical protein
MNAPCPSWDSDPVVFQKSPHRQFRRSDLLEEANFGFLWEVLRIWLCTSTGPTLDGLRCTYSMCIPLEGPFERHE